MALTLVQSKSAILQSGDSTPTVTLDATPTQGNLLVCCIMANENASDLTITDPGSFTTVTADGTTNNSGDVVIQTSWRIAPAGASATVSGSLSASRAWVIVVMEFNDSDGGTWALDAHASGTGSSTTPSTGTTGTTAAADEVAVGFVGVKNIGQSSTPTNSFTLQEEQHTGTVDATHISGAGLYRILAATGTFSTGVTLSTSRLWAANIATFSSTPAGAMPRLRAMIGVGL